MVDKRSKSRSEALAKRLARAEKDKMRKREARGGLKDSAKKYCEYKASLSADQRSALEYLLEYQHSFEIEPGSLTPISLELFQKIPFEGDRIELPKPPPVPSRPLPKRLSLTPSARRKRAEQHLIDQHRETVAFFDSMTRDDLRALVVAQWPNNDVDFAMAHLETEREKSVSFLKNHNSENSRRQALYRAKNLDKIRPAELQRTRAKRDRARQVRQNAPFVAIDAEGINVASAFPINAATEWLDLGLPERALPGSELIAQDHRTFLWGAATDGAEPKWLGYQDKRPLKGHDICEWLTSLPAHFPHAIFIMFAANYDWTQIVRDMPFETAWELWNGKPRSSEGKHIASADRRRWVLWGPYALRLYPGKYIEIGKLTDRNKIKNDKGKWDFSSKIKIYDTFGYFQTSFMRAAMGFGANFLSKDEAQIIEDGKSRRTNFIATDLSDVMRYTQAELHILSRMLKVIREGLRENELAPRDWHGAGSIAQAMMKKERIDEFYYRYDEDGSDRPTNDPLNLALHAFFGGRVEVMKQGSHPNKFFSYDISSAYPHILRQLPGMRNGQWKFLSPSDLLTSAADAIVASPDRLLVSFEAPDLPPMVQFARSDANLKDVLKLLERLSLVSMVRVRFLFPDCLRLTFSSGQATIIKSAIPWFPLPVRAEDGTIYFPSQGDGIYMVEEVRAMVRWAKTVYGSARISERPMIALLGAMEFIPKNRARPFKSLVEKGFAKRSKIVDEINRQKEVWEAEGRNGPEPYDVREKVLKLGLNSIYGKTAQSRGARVEQRPDGTLATFPPKLSNMFYAAATTAGTRSMLLDAAGSDLDGIIAFATDGIYAERDVRGLEVPATKTLGKWEASARQKGVFVKAGIYSHEPFMPVGAHATSDAPKRTTKMRGIRPTNLPDGTTAEQWLIETVPAAWASDDLVLEFPYKAYKTLGAAIASEKTWKLAGHWIEGPRIADIQLVSLKRDSRGIARHVREDGSPISGERRRSIALFPTAAAKNPMGWRLSHAYTPEWLDGRHALIVRAEEEQKTLERKSGFGFDLD